VELQTSKELLLDPVIIRSFNASEKCLIESSINSVRVSYIFKFEEADKVEKMLGKEFLSYLQKRAVDFQIVRRVPVKDYSFSFLITNRHVDKLSKKKIIAFISFFMTFVESEISELKISINARGRSIASEYMKQYS
jgi:ARP2/3 complex 20 kDa subunit (ARPC4).